MPIHEYAAFVCYCITKLMDIDYTLSFLPRNKEQATNMDAMDAFTVP